MTQDRPRCQHYYGPGRLCLAYESEHFGQYGRADHTFEAAPVPEGAQGKEPPFDEFWKVEKEALLARVVCRCSAGSTCDSSAVRVDKFAKEVFVSGEAAGRRSAITEMQEWARCRRQPTDAASMDWDAAYADALDAVITWCAELLEKTK